MNRAKEPSTTKIWVVVLALTVLRIGTSEMVAGVEVPDPRPPDNWVDVPVRVQQMNLAGDRVLVVPTDRTGFLVSHVPSSDQWVHQVPPTSRVRDVAIGMSVVAFSTLDSPDLILLEVAHGTEVARVALDEAAAALAVTDRYIIAARPQAGDVVVLDHAGEQVATVPVSGVPTSLSADDTRIIVAGARTSLLSVIEPADWSVHEVEIGTGLHSAALLGATAYVSRPEVREVVAVDLTTSTVAARLHVPDLSSGYSTFVPNIAAGDEHVVVPVYASPGLSGISAIRRDGFIVEATWWLGEYGHPLEIAVHGNIVATGSAQHEGLYEWEIQPARSGAT